MARPELPATLVKSKPIQCHVTSITKRIVEQICAKRNISESHFVRELILRHIKEIDDD